METPEENFAEKRVGEVRSGDWNLTTTTQISDSGLDSLEERISPTESLISQDTLDYIFQGFDTSGKRDFTTDSDVQSLGSDKHLEEGQGKTLSGSTSSLRDSSKSLFQRLGALYSDNQLLSSPIHRTEGKFYEEMNIQTSTHSAIRLDKLSALADSISSWEDELPLSTAGKSDKREPQIVKVTPKKNPAPQPPQTPTNPVQDDKDFVRRPSVKKFRAPDIPKLPPRNMDERKENMPVAVKSPTKGAKDPAEMSMKERLALFEKNRVASKCPEIPSSKPPLPKKPSHVSSGGIRDKIATLFSSSTSSSSNEERGSQINVENILNRPGVRKPMCDNPTDPILRPLLPPPAPPVVSSPGKRKSGELESIEMVTIREEPKRPKPSQSDNSVALQVNQLDSERQNGVAERAQVYPRRAISYDEDSSFEKSEEAPCSVPKKSNEKSLAQNVLKSLLNNAKGFDVSDSVGDLSDVSGHIEEMEEGLEDVLDVSINSSEDESRDKGSISSSSFLYQRSPVKPVISAIREERYDEDSSDEETRDSPLLHSVSFYRKQQSANQYPCHKKILSQKILEFDDPQEMREEISSAEIDNSETSEKQLQEKRKKLNDEIHKQQQIISQTSQALNLCAATVEFSGSTESVEGERHLLVATHRRLAALNELQRMNVEKSLYPKDAPPERGSLTITGITIPLAQGYVRQMATDTLPGHHLVCLLKYNEHVLATQTIVTLPGLVAVKFIDELHLPEVFADFRATLEVYGMVAHREVLPHELKYHILGKKLQLSAKKFMGGTPIKRLRKPIVESPAGPSAVRSPAFTLYGHIVFSLRESQKRSTWVINRSSIGPDPLEGMVHMRVTCRLKNTVEFRGFLTMFDDVSGLGAWHRRWCYLQGTTLNYWKYPDDETKRTPIGSLDLQQCRSAKVGPVPRDICARLNTILLEVERPSLESDKESLVLVRCGRKTIVRHLLSTDTKSDREEWCKNLNHVLRLIKCWGTTE